MMRPDAHILDRARVSISERLVPSLGLALVAISGALGGLMIFRLFFALRHAENAGMAALFGGVAEIEFFIGMVLVAAAVLFAIGILVSIIRLFTTNTTSSPPGLLFLLVGLFSLVPPFAIHYGLHLVKAVASSPSPIDGGVSTVAELVGYLSYFAIGFAGAIVLVLLAFAFIPFSSRAGRKVSPLVCLVLVEILIAVLAGVYFWEARMSIAERDKDRTVAPTYTSEPDEYSDDLPAGADANTTPDDFVADESGTNSRSNAKTISGGVLNGKAIDFPQPAYPPAARAVRATGSVNVQVMVDQKGKVVSANAVSGHPLLRAAAVQAARQATFPITKLSGQPVKVTGVLTYNFATQ